MENTESREVDNTVERDRLLKMVASPDLEMVRLGALIIFTKGTRWAQENLSTIRTIKYPCVAPHYDGLVIVNKNRNRSLRLTAFDIYYNKIRPRRAHTVHAMTLEGERLGYMYK